MPCHFSNRETDYVSCSSFTSDGNATVTGPSTGHEFRRVTCVCECVCVPSRRLPCVRDGVR